MDVIQETDIKGDNMREYNTEKNAVKEYFDGLKNTFGADKLNDLLFEKKQTKDGVFLSVIMRTQGKRIEMLREALLCLEAQTCTNFEVWVLGHNVEENDKVNVKNVISDFTKEFRDRIFYEDVLGGTRTTPLNYGFEKANGQYITIFDDDDLVFDNWVETFYDLYLENPGKILHAYAVGQDWQLIDGIPVSISPFNNVYCRDFIMNNQIVYNNCPIMTLAFPAYAYKLLGIKFDETLNTTEDWDFLMRTSFICGVCDSKNVTSIYRFWKNVQNSQSLHNEDEWMENCKKIQKGFHKFVIPMNVGKINKGSGGVIMHPSNGNDTSSIEIYIDNGGGFSQELVAEFESGFFGDNTRITLVNPEQYGKIRSIRFDPCEFGILSLSNLSIEVLDENKKPVKTKIDFNGSNFVKRNKNFIFIDSDPQIKFNFKNMVECSTITISFEMNKRLDWKTISISGIKYIFAKTYRKLRGFLSKIRAKLGV